MTPLADLLCVNSRTIYNSARVDKDPFPAGAVNERAVPVPGHRSWYSGAVLIRPLRVAPAPNGGLKMHHSARSRPADIPSGPVRAGPAGSLALASSKLAHLEQAVAVASAAVAGLLLRVLAAAVAPRPLVVAPADVVPALLLLLPLLRDGEAREAVEVAVHGVLDDS